MVRHRSLETNPWKKADLPNKVYADHGKEIFCSHTLGAVVLLVLSLAWGVQGVLGAEQPGFTQDCSGFARDPMLGALGRGMPTLEGEKQFASPAAMVPRLSLQGTALATYEKERERRTAATLETLFGMSQGAQREVVETTFYQEARAVVLYPYVLATVAHALTPDVVEVRVGPHVSVPTVPLQITQMTVLAHTAPRDTGVTAQVVHINEPYDLALVQASERGMLQPLPYPAVLSYGTGEPAHPTGGLQAAACVAAIVTRRDHGALDTDVQRLVVGKVLAKVPVATNSMTQTKLNVNMFTTDLAVQPGDSGSPVLALREGKPVLVGVISSTMYPTATFTYVSRIDPLLALADALRLAVSQKQAQLLRPHETQVSLEAR
jgi:Trypsin-like peptidase domain